MGKDNHLNDIKTQLCLDPWTCQDERMSKIRKHGHLKPRKDKFTAGKNFLDLVEVPELAPPLTRGGASPSASLAH